MRVDLGERAAGLDGEMGLGRRLELAFDDDVAVAPALDDVPFDDLRVGERVPLRYRREDLEVICQLLVDERRVRSQRLLDCQDRGQLLIIDLDQPAGLPRRRLVLGRHCRDRLADIADLADGDRGLVLDEGAHPVIAEILAGQHGMHARVGARRRGVVAQDPGVSVGALQDRAVEHSRAREIGDVLRAPGDLLDRLQFRRAEADRVRGLAHRPLPATTASTASMILR